MTTTPGTQSPQDFSLVLGGPLFQLLRRSHLCGAALELSYRRLAVITCIAAVVREMRLVPFGWQDVTRLAMITAVPLLPLLFTAFSLDDLATCVIEAIGAGFDFARCAAS